MNNIVFNFLIGKGLESMPKISKSNWVVIGVTLVLVLGMLYAIHNVDALSDVADKVGLDD